MAHKPELIRVAGRLVKVADGEKTQTINVCTPANSEGTYQEVYRIPGQRKFVSASRLQMCNSLEALDAFLVAAGAAKE